jgi:hypothetical protein
MKTKNSDSEEWKSDNANANTIKITSETKLDPISTPTTTQTAKGEITLKIKREPLIKVKGSTLRRLLSFNREKSRD